MNNFTNSSLLLVALIVGMNVCQNLIAQPGALGTNNVNGAPFTCASLNDLGAFRQLRIQATQNSSSANCEFPLNCGYPGDVWRAYAAGTSAISFNTTIAPVGGTGSALYNSSNGGSAINLSPVTSGRYYTFNIQERVAPLNCYMSVLETTYNPKTINTVSVCTGAAATNQIVQVYVTISASLSSGENVFLRYSTNGFVSSTIIPVTFNGTSGVANIPAMPLTTVVSLYVYSSNNTMANINAQVATHGQVAHDMNTLNMNNNSGANYTYTVSIPLVTLPTITPGGPTSFCPGGSVLLNTNSGFSSYLWNAVGGNATTQSITASATGTYVVTVTYSSGCTASASIDVDADDTEPPTITCPDDDDINLGPTCSITLSNYTGSATAADDCITVNVTQLPTTGTVINGHGTTEVTLTATDGSGNTAACNFDVNRIDITPPTITCPSGPVTLFVNSSCMITVPTFSPNSFSDNCNQTAVTQTPLAGITLTGVGNTTVQLTITDAGSNTATCSFLLQRQDNIDPVITCPGTQTIVLNETCSATLPTYSPATLSDNCGVPTVSQSPPFSSTVSGTGSVTITLTATDASSNTATCSFSLNKVDITPPTVTCPGNGSVVLDAACSAIIPAFTPVSMTDNCSAVTFQQSPAAASTTTGSGVITVTLTASDASNNTATCTLSLNRIDNSSPIITCPQNQFLTFGPTCSVALPAYSLASVSDNCSTTTQGQSPAAGTLLTAEINQITLSANDGFNTAICNFTVFVEDVTSPVIICPTNQTLSLGTGCSATLPFYNPVSNTDNCFVPTFTQAPAGNTILTGAGTTTVVLTASDIKNNTSSCSFTVNRTDNVPPTITCPSTQTLILGTTCSVALPGYSPTSVADNCNTPSVTQSPVSGTIISGIGSTTVTLTANDNAGSTATCSFTINKIDNASPTISCPAPQFLSLVGGCSVPLPAYSPAAMADNCGTPAVSQIPAAGTVLSGAGTSTVSLTVTDGNGNSTSCSFTVNRADATPPTITCPSTQNILLNASCSGTLAGYSPASVADNCTTPTVTQLPVSGTTVSGIGTTTVTLTANDGNGNTASCSFAVNRLDVNPPTVSCPATQTLTLGSACSVVLPAYSATASSDNCTPPTISQSPAASSVLTGTGTATVMLTATDVSGNTGTCSFTVNKIDTSSPTISCPSTQTIFLNASCQGILGTYSATSVADNCGTPTVTQSPSAGTTVTGLGSTTVVLTVGDGNGNSNSCSFAVTRLDNTPPGITCPGTQTINLNASCMGTLGTYSAAATSDNCSSVTVSQSPASGTSLSGVGTSTVVLTANDGNGNTASCAFGVTRTDPIAPSIICPATQTVTLGSSCSATLSTYTAAATDNCSTPTTTQSPPTGTTITGVGVSTVTMTANDGNGNTSTCSFLVNKIDTTNPTITCPANIIAPAENGTCEADVSWSDPVTNDNCGIESLDSTFNPGSAFEGITTVVYTVEDISGNTASCSFTVTINDGQAPVLTPCPSNIVSCNNIASWTPPTATDNCGQVTVTGTHTSGSQFPLGNTTVTYTATDNVGNSSTCSFVITVSLLSVAQSVSNFNGFNISCNGGNNGSITVTPSNGLPPYTYQWSNGTSGTNSISGLSSGFYTVTIGDSSGCNTVRSFVLTQPTPLNCNATGTNITCNGANDGTVSVTQTGGVPPYSYSWSGPGGPFGNVSGLTELAPGAYTVTVTDLNGCVCVSSVTITEPPVVPVLTGINENITEGEGGVIPAFYNVNIITFTGGQSPYNYSWNISGYVLWSIPTPGTIQIIYADYAAWSVTISDSNGCGVSTLVFSNSPTGTDPDGVLNIVNSVITSDFGTGNGSIVLTVAGGITCPGGDYQYQWAGPSTWTGAPAATMGSISSLAAGWYIVTVTDCSVPPEYTIGWFWVPKKARGRGKVEFNENLLQIAPNPFAGNLNASFSWPQDDVVKLTVYDLLGKEVSTLFEGAVAEGELYAANYDTKDLPSGLYICRLVNKNGNAVHRRALLIHGN